MGTLRQMLGRRDLDVDEPTLVSALEACLDRASGPPYPKPADHLSPQQMEVLAKGGFQVDPPGHQIEDPTIRAAVFFTALVVTSLSTKRAAERIHLSEGRIRQLLKENALYGIKVGKDWRLPLFQFDEDGLVRNIGPVLQSLSRELALVAAHHWFTHPEPDLEVEGVAVSPLQWLRSGGKPEIVAELVQDLR